MAHGVKVSAGLSPVRIDMVQQDRHFRSNDDRAGRPGRDGMSTPSI